MTADINQEEAGRSTSQLIKTKSRVESKTRHSRGEDHHADSSYDE
jgi:hypothetical protein